MRAFIDTLVAVKGTVTVALRRAHPRVLVGGGLVAVAVLVGALYLVAIAPGGEDVGGPGAALGDSTAGSGASSGASGDPAAGDSLTDGLVQDASDVSDVSGGAPRGSVPAAPAPVAPGAGVVADGAAADPGESTPPAPAVAPTTGRSSTTTAAPPSTTPGDTSSSTTSTTAPTGTTAPGQGGLFGGLLDLLGLG